MNTHEIYKAAIEHYGRETQMLVCMEEMAELIQAICKRLRGIDNFDNLAEEMADVRITQAQLYEMFRKEALESVGWKIEKLERLEQRIAEDKAWKKRVVDAVEVVRCKDCKHRSEGSKMCAHPKAIGWDAIEPEDEDFCSYGEPKEGRQ